MEGARLRLRKLGARALGLLFTVLASTAVVYWVLASAPGAEEQMPGFGTWLLGVLQGDLGTSSRYRVGESVALLLNRAGRESVVIVGLALLWALLGGAFLTVLWTSRSKPITRRLSRGLTYAISASPVFLLCYWSIVAVNNSVASAVKAGTIERPLWFPVPIDEGFVRYLMAALVLSMGSGTLMETARGLTHEVERLMRSQFIMFARARGRPLHKHLGPALIGPVTSIAINRLTGIFGGAVIVEVIFNIPGLGRLTWDAALSRDSRLLLGATAAWAVVFAFARLLAQLIQELSDPKRSSNVDEGSS